MKSSLQALLPSARFRVGLGLLGFSLGAGMLAAQIVVPEWALPAEYGSDQPDHIVFTMGGASISGDTARFQERSGLSRLGFVGISDMSMFRELGEDADRVLKVDLRAMGGLNELDLDISYEKLEAWRVEFSMRQYRRYFDPTGGMPAAGFEDVDFHPNALELDFGVIRLEAERAFEELPTLRFRYTRRYRDGERASTIWGQQGAKRTGAAMRIVDESSDTIDVEAEERSDNYRWKISGHYEHAESESTLLATNDSGVNPAEPMEQSQSTESDRLTANGYLVRKVFENGTISVGGTMTEVDANVTGYRQVSNGSAFVNLSGDSDLYQYAVNGNLAYRWSPSIDSVIAIGVRGEDLAAESRKNLGTGPNAVVTIDERDFVDLAFETRLHTSRRASFYVLAKQTKGDGVLDEEGDRISRVTNSDETTKRYAAGFRIQAAPGTSVSGEIYHRKRSTEFVHERRDTFPVLYPGNIRLLEELVDDANLRVTMRPHSKLHLVSRADVLHRSIRPSFNDSVGKIETKVDHLTLSQNLSFTPRPGLVIQAMASWTENLHRTPLSAAGGELARVLPESLNDHWSLQLGVYATLNDQTDLQLDYTFFHANNFFDNSDVAVPFGTAEEEHQLNVILTRQFTERLRGLVRYGYFQGRDLTQTDLKDYEAHVLYTSFHFRF